MTDKITNFQNIENSGVDGSFESKKQAVRVHKKGTNAEKAVYAVLGVGIALILIGLFFFVQSNFNAIPSANNSPPTVVTSSKLIPFIQTPTPSAKCGSFITDLPGYKATNVLIDLNVVLRGSHKLYAFVDGNEDLKLIIRKKDTNKYPGKDELTIKVSDSLGKVLTEHTLEDDGIDDNSGTVSNIQEASIIVKKPQKGVYRIDLISSKNDDFLIESIKTTQNKIVFSERIFPQSKATLYVHSTRDTNATFIIFHTTAIQQIKINDEKNNPKLIDLNSRYIKTEISLEQNKNYTINLPKGNVLIQTANASYALTKNNLFLIKTIDKNSCKVD